ncbi:hypothetical protein H2199_001042 [Coniosporium tulheliwenetii]|uniref:Uncharacterized protein n=1 Tax=Coniosporium tulheliwenetii TaxID=3383036 RepID=A0ACC2ZKR3_9PEZI|nr:hypothetical protein H2199_001042 [Cladosporium sp. JES 115]
MSPEDLNAFLDFQCAPNSGFLKRIFSREKNARRMYHAINWLINLLLIGQAALSIVLVAVDVGEKGHQKVVEILGIINGIITAILAIIKGQGLPGRYYQYAAGLREVMREVEELRRTIASNGVKMLRLEEEEEENEERVENGTSE